MSRDRIIPSWRRRQDQRPNMAGNMVGNMAEKSYASVVQNVDEHSIDSVKPIFILETDLFGDVLPNKDQYLTHVEMYKAVDAVVMGSHLKGLQRVRGLWRVYLDNEDDRDKLITTGLVIRSKQIQIYSNNPKVAQFSNPNHLRVRVKNIPCSAEDGQITRALEQIGCVVHNLYRERLRVDGMLTNCQTGDRIAICDPVTEPLPKSLTIGKYWANIIHRNQTTETKKIICNKCFSEGHKLNECPNDWVCKTCHTAGHKQAECPVTFTDDEGEDDMDQSTVTDNELSDNTAEDTQSLEIVPTTGSSSIDNLIEEESTEDTLQSADNASANTSQKLAHTIASSSASTGKMKKSNKPSNKDRRPKAQSQGQIEQYLKPTKEQGSETPNTRREKRDATTPTDELHTRTGSGPKSLVK